ncbi:MAG TPA: pentapeptide repeat-containing protein [Ktedonobacteraceae bacterium]
MEKKQSQRSPEFRTIWNWIQFPVLVLLLITSVIWLTIQQGRMTLQIEQQQHTTALLIAQNQQQEALLSNYIDAISDLMVHDKLFTAKSNDPATVIAETRTQEVLNKLDPDRKATLMSFLYGTKLIGNDYHIISMVGANLHDANLHNIDLRDTYLIGANLSGANLQGANLNFATLSYINLSGANLSGATLTGSELHSVDLTGANLSKANLKDAFDLGDTLLAQAKSLSGTTMPDGTVHS